MGIILDDITGTFNGHHGMSSLSECFQIPQTETGRFHAGDAPYRFAVAPCRRVTGLRAEAGDSAAVALTLYGAFILDPARADAWRGQRIIGESDLFPLWSQAYRDAQARNRALFESCRDEMRRLGPSSRFSDVTRWVVESLVPTYQKMDNDRPVPAVAIPFKSKGRI